MWGARTYSLAPLLLSRHCSAGEAPADNEVWQGGDSDRRQWSKGAPSTSDSSNSGAEPVAASADIETTEGGPQTLPPRSALVTASLASLRVAGGDEPFDLCGCPHLIATARALLTALSPPVDTRYAWCHEILPNPFLTPLHIQHPSLSTSYAAEKLASVASGAEAAAENDVSMVRRFGHAKPPAEVGSRAARVYAASAGLASVAWLSGRAIVVHQRSLIERKPSALMWRRCVPCVY